MHEASIAQSLIESVMSLQQQGTVRGRVTKIHLKIGRLTAVVPDNLRFMFSVIAEGGPLEHVQLEIQEIRVQGHCRTCGSSFEIDEAKFMCAECDSVELDIVAGRELLIDAVEVDDDGNDATSERSYPHSASE